MDVLDSFDPLTDIYLDILNQEIYSLIDPDKREADRHHPVKVVVSLRILAMLDLNAHHIWKLFPSDVTHNPAAKAVLDEKIPKFVQGLESEIKNKIKPDTKLEIPVKHFNVVTQRISTFVKHEAVRPFFSQEIPVRWPSQAQNVLEFFGRRTFNGQVAPTPFVIKCIIRMHDVMVLQKNGLGVPYAAPNPKPQSSRIHVKNEKEVLEEFVHLDEERNISACIPFRELVVQYLQTHEAALLNMKSEQEDQ